MRCWCAEGGVLRVVMVLRVVLVQLDFERVVAVHKKVAPLVAQARAADNPILLLETQLDNQVVSQRERE